MSKSPRHRPGASPTLRTGTSTRAHDSRLAMYDSRYYLLNNYNPGYFGNGKDAYTDQNPSNTPFTGPPSSVRSTASQCCRVPPAFTAFRCEGSSRRHG